MRATKGLLKGLNPTMAMTALTVVTLFLLFGVFDPDTAGTWFTGAKDHIIAGFKWYYILVVALFLFFAVYLMFSRFGSIRLGDDDQVPEFGYFAWFSMLFSAGMGIGLVFWSIAEPMNEVSQRPRSGLVQNSRRNGPTAGGLGAGGRRASSLSSTALPSRSSADTATPRPPARRPGRCPRRGPRRRRGRCARRQRRCWAAAPSGSWP